MNGALFYHHCQPYHVKITWILTRYHSAMLEPSGDLMLKHARQMRFACENERDLLIIKFMPGVARETTAVEFCTHVRARIAQLPGQLLFLVIGLGLSSLGTTGQ